MTFQRCDVCKRAEEGHKRKVRTTLQTVVTSAWVGQARLKWVLEMVMGTWATKAQEREREKKKKNRARLWGMGLWAGHGIQGHIVQLYVVTHCTAWDLDGNRDNRAGLL